MAGNVANVGGMNRSPFQYFTNQELGCECRVSVACRLKIESRKHEKTKARRKMQLVAAETHHQASDSGFVFSIFRAFVLELVKR
jgi:hypothetical protein